MSIVSKIQALLSAANTKTGQSDTDLTSAVQHLCDGYGSGGGSTTGSIDTTNIEKGTFGIGNVGSDNAKIFTVQTTKKCSNIVVVPTLTMSGMGNIMCLIYTDNLKICPYFWSNVMYFAKIDNPTNRGIEVSFEDTSITFGYYGTGNIYFPVNNAVAWIAW